MKRCCGRRLLCASTFFLMLEIIMVSAAFAQTPGRRAASLMQEDMNARRLGIGSAGTALLDDITAIYVNPAGLAASDDYQAYLDIGRTNSGDLWKTAAYSAPIRRKATIAIGITGLSTNDEPNRSRIGQDGTYGSSAIPLDEDHVLADLAVGRFIRPDLSIGLGARYVRTSSKDALENYEGLCGSVGVRYNSARTGLVIGANVRNFGRRISGAADPGIPITAAVGFSYGVMRSTAHYVNFAIDAVHVQKRGTFLRAGVEYWFANFVALRAGFDDAASRRPTNPYEGRFSAGMSLNFSGVLFDFVAIPDGTRIESSKLAGSLRFNFGEGRRR